MASGPDKLPDLPHPPPSHPFRLRSCAAAHWFRVHIFDPASGRYAPDAFNDSTDGNARFSPLVDPATGKVIPTIYAAASEAGAISEVVLHDVPTPSTGYLHDWERDKAGPLHLSKIALPALKLADLQSQGLQAAGLEQWEMFGTNQPDYPRTRAWALHVWQSLPKAQGLLWMSRRANDSAVLMLFRDRVPAGVPAVMSGPAPIARYESIVFDILDRLGCGIALS
jgi:hypothetical protein